MAGMISNRLNLIIIGVMAIILAGLSIEVFTLRRQNANLKSYESLYNVSNQENKIFRFKDSTWHNVSQVAVVSKSELTNVKELQNLHNEFDGIKRSLKNLENYTKLSEVTTIHKTVRLKDTVIYLPDSSKQTVKTFTYKDKFETIKEIISSDTVIMDIQHRDSLEVVQYWDRKWFLGKKKYYTEIKSANPNTVVDYQRSIKTERKRGLFGF